MFSTHETHVLYTLGVKVHWEVSHVAWEILLEAVSGKCDKRIISIISVVPQVF